MCLLGKAIRPCPCWAYVAETGGSDRRFSVLMTTQALSLTKAARYR